MEQPLPLTAGAPPPPSPPKRPRGRPRKRQAVGPAAPPSPLLIEFERDRCTCTYAELQSRWTNEQRKAIEHELGETWDSLVPKTHNPIYYLAERVWFDNAAALGNPRFLYAPLHRDRYCAAILHYMLVDTSSEALLLLGPRDTYKSTLADCTGMWFALRRKHLDKIDMRVVLRHHKEKMASRGLRRIKAKLMHHPYMLRFWSEYCPPPRSKELGTRTEFSLPNAGAEGEQGEETFRAIGMTASDTGSHSDLDIGDDLVTEDHITSKAVRDETKLMYEAKQFTRDTGTGKEINFGTPYHLNDLWGAMMKANTEGDANYRVVVVPAMEDSCRRCGHDELAHSREQEGKPAELNACAKAGCGCPEADIYAHPYRLNKEFLEKRRQAEINRTGRDVMWWLQYQCRARLSGIVVADKSWFRYVSQHDVSPRAWRIILVDGAWKGTKNAGEGCAASIQVWAIERRASLLLRTLLDGVHSRELTAADGRKEIFRLMGKHGALDVGVEESGGYTFRGELEAEATTRGAMLNLLDFQSKQTHKHTRMATFLGEMQTGRIFVAKECDPTLREAYESQVLDFPQTNPNDDDALDCAAYVCDKEIVESYAPQWNQQATAEIFRTPAPDERRTRWCAA